MFDRFRRKKKVESVTVENKPVTKSGKRKVPNPEKKKTFKKRRSEAAKMESEQF